MLFSLYPYQNFSDYNIDWVINTVKELTPQLTHLEEWMNEFEEEYDELKTMYDNIMAGKFPDSMMDALYKWLERNAVSIVGAMVKTVFFGLTDGGHFCAFIPDSWSDITFKTTEYDINISCQTEFGHLVLCY